MREICVGYKYSLQEIKKKVEVALGILLKNDSFLLEHGANERSVSHRLAEYLQTEFPDWNVDCEYNLDGINTKELERIQECGDRTTDRVLPDIIVHLRGTINNLLVVELKKKNLNPRCDKKKLELFTNQKGKYKYFMGLFAELNGVSRPELIWYKNGQSLDK